MLPRFWTRNSYLALPGVLSIALSVAACAFVFSLIEGVLLTPLPYDEAERLVLLRARNVRLGETRPFVSVADFRDWQREASSFDGMALFHWIQMDLWGEGGRSTERLQGLAVTPEFFSVMGLEPAVGGWPDEERLALGGDVVVLGHPLWSRRFGADPSLVGETIAIGSWRSLPAIGSVRYRVEAVVSGPSRFLPMSRGIGRQPVGVDDTVDFFLPMSLDQEPVPPREHRDRAGAIARLRAGVSREQAQAELESLAAGLSQQHPDTNASWSVELVPLREAVTGPIRPVLLLLFIGVASLFLISCSNVGSLQLVRTMDRRRELAVKRALGASGVRLVGELVAETVALAAWGSVLGLGLAAVGLRLLETLAPPELPRIDAVGIDAVVLLFATGLVVTAAFLSGWGPAWLVARAERDSGPGLGLGSGFSTANASRESRRLLSAFATVAVALSVMLLIAAGLVHQSLSRLLDVDPGYDRENLLTLTLSLPEAKYPWRRNTEFVHEVIDHVSSLPGVAAAGVVRGLPGRESRIEAPVFLPGRLEGPIESRPRAQIRLVSPSYFEVMRVPVLRGRGFEPGDERGEIGYTRVVLVNATFAERFWPGGTAVGKTIHVVRSDLPPVEIVGVVGDVRYRGLEHPPGPEIYYPEALFPQAQADLILRTATPPLDVAAPVQDAIRELEPDVLISNVGTMEGVLRHSVADRRFASFLLNAFSTTALLLAAVGVAGVMAQSVSQRRKELGVRLALGARPGPIMGRVLARSVALCSIGLVLGTVVAVAATRGLSRFLYAIEPTDPATYVGAAVLTAAAATLASLIPAWSAAATDPLGVLRQD